MKRIIILVVSVLLSALPLMAQSLKVSSFRDLPNDLDARVNFPKLDLNGKKCAIIKVVGSGGLKLEEGKLRFENGSMGIVEVVHKKGEIWVYVPTPMRKISIFHEVYGNIRDYQLGMAITEASCYELKLTLEGKDVMFRTSINGASLQIDGEVAGQSPMMVYLPFGQHIVKAQSGNFVGEVHIDVRSDGASEYSVEMEDMTKNYGQVEIKAGKSTEIYFRGELKGVGSWKAFLPEGIYAVETRREGCENRETTFAITAQQSLEVKAEEPEPYSGYLRLLLEPRDAAVYKGSEKLPQSSVLQFNIGHYDLTYKKKGYYTQTREYTFERNREIADTVRLQPIQYIKKTTAYFGLNYTYQSLMGATVMLGGVWRNNDLSVSYTMGLTKSECVYWYDENMLPYNAAQYSFNTISARYGYQLILASRFALTPQVGFALVTAKGSSQIYSTDPVGDGATCCNVSLGVKLQVALFHHCCLCLVPEYAIQVQGSEAIKAIAEAGGVQSGGFAAHAGIIISL